MIFIWIVVGIVLSYIIYFLAKYLWHRHQYPYRWKCKQCGFTIETNLRETFEISKSSHNHSSTKEYRYNG